MINIVMLVCGRPRLTTQALNSLALNSVLPHSVTIVDDASPIRGVVYPDNTTVLRADKPVGVTSRLRNLGVYWSEKMFGRGEYLYLSDNDAYFLPAWDRILVDAYKVAFLEGYKMIGPYRHPYHLRREQDPIVEVSSVHTVWSTDAVQGIGHLMKWEVWDKYGPLHDVGAKGTNQSEDYKFCMDIRGDGFHVGSIQPDVVWNCGLTGSAGKPAIGVEVMKRYPNVVME